ncbi:MAG TPA: hypothetical protein PLS26_10120, partial [Bacteroidales bacterium]|nr:hypothetical protein [Bacteroidales bacterium]
MKKVVKKLVQINLILFYLIGKVYSFGQIPYNEPRAIIDEDISKAISCTNNSNCYINKYYDKYNEDLSFWKPNSNSVIKIIKVNFIVIQKDDGTGNFSHNGVCPLETNKTDEEFLYELIDKVNNLYYNNLTNPSDTGGKSVCGTCNEIADTKIRFELQGIHYYQNSAVYGTESNIYKYYPDSEINIYLQGLNLNYSWANLASFYLSTNNYVFLNRLYQDYCLYGYYPALNAAAQLSHELGHNLGLCHTYYGGGCPITSGNMYNEGYYYDDLFGAYPSIFCPDRGGVWNSDPWSDPGDYITNNLMGFTVTARYLSSKQIATMHRNLSIKSTRKYVKTNVFDNNNAIEISENESWDFDIRCYSDIVVKSGITWVVECKILMPNDAKIIVEPGAKLILDGGYITNCSNTFWQGIEVHGNSALSQYPISGAYQQGIVQIINGGTIENAVCGIKTINSDASNPSLTTGGIIRADHAVFHNCKTTIEFLPYQNYQPANNNMPI